MITSAGKPKIENSPCCYIFATHTRLLSSAPVDFLSRGRQLLHPLAASRAQRSPVYVGNNNRATMMNLMHRCMCFRTTKLLLPWLLALIFMYSTIKPGAAFVSISQSSGKLSPPQRTTNTLSSIGSEMIYIVKFILIKNDLY